MKASLCLYVFLFLQYSGHARAEPATCFLHGRLISKTDEAAKPKLEDTIRMKFDANEKGKCEKMLASYCKYNITNEYSPKKLEAYFKNTKGKKTFYTLSDNCKLSSPTEND